MKVMYLALVFALLTGTFAAQKSADLSSGTITITGTSSLHDWDMTAESFTVDAHVSRSSEGLPVVEDLKVNVKVASLKSTKGRIMDNKAYDALKEATHPNIFFTLNQVQSTHKNGNCFTLKILGDLSIAGVSKSVTMDVKATPLNNGFTRFEGVKPLKMSSFGIEPPTALLGTLKTGDDISVVFDITLSESGL